MDCTPLPRPYFPPLLLFLLSLAAFLSAFLPLAFLLDWPIGGLLEAGQAAPDRWGLAMAVAAFLFVFVSWHWPRPLRIYWLIMLGIGLLSMIVMFCRIASWPVADASAGAREAFAKVRTVGVLTALPLFWRDEAGMPRVLREKDANAAASPIRNLLQGKESAIDAVSAATLAPLDALLVAHPRLLQPQELVALDQWVRAGGRAVILADPFLSWTSALPPGDVRRPPVTSLLDPLLTHWGLRLDPALAGHDGVERRFLSTGHALILSTASSFSLVPEAGGAARCRMEERGLMALCHIGRGQVRLIADADFLDEKLWLVAPGWAGRPQAWAADTPLLLRSWLAAPLAPATQALPRIRDEGAVMRGLRAALALSLVWAGLGWLGQRLLLARICAGGRSVFRNKERTRGAVAQIGDKEMR